MAFTHLLHRTSASGSAQLETTLSIIVISGLAYPSPSGLVTLLVFRKAPQHVGTDHVQAHRRVALNFQIPHVLPRHTHGERERQLLAVGCCLRNSPSGKRKLILEIQSVLLRPSAQAFICGDIRAHPCLACAAEFSLVVRISPCPVPNSSLFSIQIALCRPNILAVRRTIMLVMALGWV